MVNEVFKEIYKLWKSGYKGKRVNRGGGFGLEIPCEYVFVGDNFSCERLHRKLIEEEFDAQRYQGADNMTSVTVREQK